MKFKPLFDRVVIKNLERKNQTKSGLFIPESVGDEPIYGEVVSVGAGDTFDGNKSPMQVKPKDKVLYNKYGAAEFKCDDEELVILRQSDILGIFMEEE